MTEVDLTGIFTKKDKCNKCGEEFIYNTKHECKKQFTKVQDSGSRREFKTGAVRDIQETFNKCDTNITEKKENFDTFVKLIKNQFWHGGEKYALSNTKEFTDGICECFPGVSGVDWVLGTCMKYLGRYKNFGREKDLLKIATYMYILWLKNGFHLEEKHDEDIFKK